MLIPLKASTSLQEEGSHANKPQVQKLQLQFQVYIHTLVCVYKENGKKGQRQTIHQTVSITSTC